jgi:nitric oxide reductase subunit C
MNGGERRMLTLQQAKWFFLGGTAVTFAIFLLLTVHTFTRIPALSNQDQMTEQVIHGKRLWDEKNCMGCHTILGEGAYYAPELTKVYSRRGPAFIRAMLKDPEGMYPGQRRMVQNPFTDEELEAFVAYFEWVGRIDTNGFPPQPSLLTVAMPAARGVPSIVDRLDRPKVFNQLCIACHSLGGQGGNVGPALDTVGARMSRAEFVTWLENPQQVRPGSAMPDLPLTDAQIAELAAFLVQLQGPGTVATASPAAAPATGPAQDAAPAAPAATPTAPNSPPSPAPARATPGD